MSSTAWHERPLLAWLAVLAWWHLLLSVACTTAQDAPHTLDCAAQVNVNHVRTLSERSGGNYTLLRAAATRYLHSLLDAPVAAGCEMVSLTHKQLHVAASVAANSRRGTPAPDIWPPGGPVRPLAQQDGVSTVNGTQADIAAARVQRHEVWTHARVVAEEPLGVRRQSAALVVTSDGLETLQSQLEVRAPAGCAPRAAPYGARAASERAL